MKNYVTRFFKDEEGAEVLEWAIVVACTVALILVLMAIVSVVKNKMLDSGEKLDNVGTGEAEADWEAHKDDSINETLQQLEE